MSSLSLFRQAYAPTPTGTPLARLEWHKGDGKGFLRASLCYDLPNRPFLSTPVYQSEWSVGEEGKAKRALRSAARRNGFTLPAKAEGKGAST